MKYSISCLFSIFVFINLFSQEKKNMDHSVYKGWKEIVNSVISDDGRFVIFEVNPQQGDGMSVVYSLNDNSYDSIHRATGTKLIPGNDFIACTIKPPFEEMRKAKNSKKKSEDLPGDSLLIYSFTNGFVGGYSDIRSWKPANDLNPWIVLHHNFRENKDLSEEETEEDLVTEESGSFEEEIDKKFKIIAKKYKLADLVILNPYSQKTFVYENVSGYEISENGEMVIFHQLSHDSLVVSVVYTFNTLDESLKLIYDGTGVVPSLAVDDAGQQMAFLHSSDTGMVAGFDLYYWKNGLESPRLLIDSLGNGILRGWGINKKGRLYFSGDGKKLFTGTSAIPPAEAKDSLSDDEKPMFDLWSYTDSYIQPQQKKMLNTEKSRTYLACFDFERNCFFQLADTLLKEIRTMHKSNGKYILGFNNEKYVSRSSWEGGRSRDVWLIDTECGEKKCILTGKVSSASLSPAGHYVLYYEPVDSSWFVYEIESGKITNLTSAIGIPFYYEDNDLPMEPESYGVAGFIKDDEYVLIYDRYDIWMIDPSGKKSCINLTGGLGRLNNIRYRYLRYDPDEYFIDPAQAIYLSCFDEETMESGYARIDNILKPSIKLLTFSPHSYSSLLKAKDSEIFIFRRGNFKEYPDLYQTDMKFRRYERISDANPQSQGYLWGDVRLVEWVSYNNDSLKGLLYTPENLDPDKKYPMLVYFYEKNSESLYSHRIPSASRSIISIPWCTSNDYVVFVPDITYRVGYPGQSAFDAIVSGTKAMLQKFDFIDSLNLGLQGQSWGGYQVAWLVTRTDIYKAAMAGAPVSNMTSAYGGIRWATGISRMFQYEKTQSRIGATLWEKPELYIENSPLFSATEVRTPLLLMHNDNDGAVPWYQSIEYFMALRRLDKPVWLLSYNGEEHNLTKWPNRVDLSIRMMGFFDYYLKDKPMPTWMKEGIPALNKGHVNAY